LLEYANAIVGWEVPGAQVTVSWDLTLSERNYFKCGTHVDNKVGSLTSTAFVVATPGIGIYVRQWPFISVQLSSIQPGLGIVAGGYSVDFAPALLGKIFAGNLAAGVLPGAGARRLNATEVAFYEKYIKDNKSLFMPMPGGEVGVGCKNGQLVQIDLDGPRRWITSIPNDVTLPISGPSGFECCKPATCEVQLSLPACELPDAPTYRDPKPIKQAVVHARKRIEINGNQAIITITLKNFGPNTTELKVEDRIPDGLDGVSGVLFDRGEATYDAANKRITATVKVFNDPTTLNQNPHQTEPRLCVNDVAKLTYVATINDATKIYDWVQVTYTDTIDPDATPNNLPPNPDDYSADCREHDESRASESTVDFVPDTVDCVDDAPVSTECVPCLAPTPSYGVYENAKDRRGIGCCTTVQIFRKATYAHAQCGSLTGSEPANNQSCVGVTLGSSGSHNFQCADLTIAQHLKYKPLDEE
jgi:hypothetical protein